MTGRVVLADGTGPANAGDPDDAVFTGTPSPDSVVALSGDLAVTFARPRDLAPALDVLLQFTIRDASGAVVSLEPYLGMPGHAIVQRTDGVVFAHLHSNGSFSMAAQQVLLAVERGDTLESRVPGVPRPRLDSAHAASHAPKAAGQLEFPFAFPTPGAYIVWVQFRSSTVRTAAFSIIVP
jgi:hypothetical protein